VTLDELIAQASPISARFQSDVMPGGPNFVSEPV